MVDFWDRLFHTIPTIADPTGGLTDNDPSVASQPFLHALRSYVRGNIASRVQFFNVVKDSANDPQPLSTADQAQAELLLDLLDAEVGEAAKRNKMEAVEDALMLVEGHWITKAQAKASLGL